MKKRVLSIEDAFNLMVDGASTVAPEVVEDDFKALIQIGENGKVVVPTDPEEKRDWFIDLVCTAADKGMTKKQITASLAALFISGRYVGEKTAETMYRHAIEKIRLEAIYEEFPNNSLTDDTEKKVVAAFWGQKPTVKIDSIDYPTICLLDKEVFNHYATAVRLAKKDNKLAEGETLSEEETLLKDSSFDAFKVAAGSLPIAREKIAGTLKKYFNVGIGTSARGRGANLYAAIGSEIDFDCME